MQGPPALDPVELPLDANDALANEAPVGLNLAFARSAEKAEAAALSLEMGPRAHEAGALVVQMGELDLQRALGGPGSAAEDFENKPGAVDHLAAERPFKISLLRRRQGAVEDDKIDVLGFDFGGDGFNLALADVGRRPNGAERHGLGAHDRKVDRSCEPDRLLAARSGAPRQFGPFPNQIRTDDPGAGARHRLPPSIVR